MGNQGLTHTFCNPVRATWTAICAQAPNSVHFLDKKVAFFTCSTFPAPGHDTWQNSSTTSLVKSAHGPCDLKTMLHTVEPTSATPKQCTIPRQSLYVHTLRKTTNATCIRGLRGSSTSHGRRTVQRSPGCAWPGGARGSTTVAADCPSRTCPVPSGCSLLRSRCFLLLGARLSSTGSCNMKLLAVRALGHSEPEET